MKQGLGFGVLCEALLDGQSHLNSASRRISTKCRVKEGRVERRGVTHDFDEQLASTAHERKGLCRHHVDCRVVLESRLDLVEGELVQALDPAHDSARKAVGVGYDRDM
jgi:hypothetical protein